MDDARFQLTEASLKGTFRAGYDQRPTAQAIKELALFVDDYPDSGLVVEAVERIQGLRERRAEHEFQVAQFYERQEQFDAALLYYTQVVTEYAETSAAAQAAERLQALSPILRIGDPEDGQ